MIYYTLFETRTICCNTLPRRPEKTSLQPGKLTFLFKYVDDIIAGIDSECVHTLWNAINSQLHGLTARVDQENDSHEVNYLNLTVGRYPDDNNIVHMKWWQKECSAKHILDFHSFHPKNVKDCVAQEFINSALRISSAQHWCEVIRNVRITLRRSNYPNKLIDEKIHTAQQRFGKIIISSAVGHTDVDPIELTKFYDKNQLEHQLEHTLNMPAMNVPMKPKPKKRYFAHPFHPPVLNFSSKVIKKLKFRQR